MLLNLNFVQINLFFKFIEKNNHVRSKNIRVFVLLKMSNLPNTFTFDSVVFVPISVVTRHVYNPVSLELSSRRVSVPPRGVILLLRLIGTLSLNHCKVGRKVPVVGNEV